MNDAPSYFDNVYEDEWIEDPFVKEMIQDVDSSTVLNAHIIESPILGPITPKELSGGVKVLKGSYHFRVGGCLSEQAVQHSSV